MVTGLFPDDDEYRYSLWLVCEATNSALGGTMSVTEEEQDMTRPILGLCQVEIGFNLFVMLAELRLK